MAVHVCPARHCRDQCQAMAVASLLLYSTSRLRWQLEHAHVQVSTTRHTTHITLPTDERVAKWLASPPATVPDPPADKTKAAAPGKTATQQPQKSFAAPPHADSAADTEPAPMAVPLPSTLPRRQAQDATAAKQPQPAHALDKVQALLAELHATSHDRVKFAMLQA